MQCRVASIFRFDGGRPRQKYDIKTQRIGKGKTRNGENKKQGSQVRIRVVRRAEDGWDFEADLGHAESIVEQLGLIDGNTVSTPGTAALIPLTADEDNK